MVPDKRRWIGAFFCAMVLSALVVGVPRQPAAAQDPLPDAIVVLDLSASMDGPRLAAAKGALTNLVSGFDPGELNLGLRTFTDCGVSSSVVGLGPVDPPGFTATVNGLVADGPATDISTALTAAAGSLSAGGTVVLVSDGSHNCGPPQPCDAARQIAAQGLDIRVDTVSFQIADPLAVAELQCIAQVTGGSSFGVDDQDALEDALRRGIEDDPPTPTPDIELGTAVIDSPYVATASDPVQVSTGNFTDSMRDLWFGTSLYAMDLVRSYNSISVDPATSTDPQASVLGRGWRLSHQITAVAGADGRVAVTLGSGRIVRFEPDPSGGFERPEGFFGELVEDGGQYRIELFNGERWDFLDGRVTVMTSPDRGSVHLDHNAAGRLITIRSSLGPSYRLRYDTDGRLTEVASIVNREVDRSVSYAYDTDGDLAEVTDAEGAVTRYTTDDDGRILAITDATGVVSVEMTYDDDGRVATQTTPTGELNEFTYEAGQTTLTVTAAIDGTGATRTDVYRYGSNEDGLTVSMTDPLGAEVDIERNADGQATTGADRRATADGDPAGSLVEQTFDQFGNVTSETAPGVGTTTYTYSYTATAADGSEITLHRLVSSTAPNGGVTNYSYEGTDTVPSRITGPEGLEVVNRVHDGLVRRTTDADGVTTSFGYDRFRRLTSVTDGVGNTTWMLYDDAGRPTRVIDPSGAATTMTYDDEDRLVSVTDRTGAVTTRSYDAEGRITAYADALDSVPGIDSRRELTYDDAGLLASITDQRGGTTSFDYNGFGQLTATTAPGGATWQFEFSELGRVDAAVDPLGEDRTIGFDHDVEGLLGGVEAADGSTTGIVYDDADRPVRLTDRNGIVSTFAYDTTGGGQLLGERYAVGTTDEAGVTYTYDDQYRLTSVSGPRPEQVVRYDYSPAGRVVAVTDANGNTFAYHYDAAGRVASVTQPGDRVVTYHYDANSRIVALTTPEGLRYGTVYDLEGRITELRAPSGVVTRFSYDGNGRVTSATLGGSCSAGGEPAPCPDVDFGDVRLLATPSGPARSAVVPIDEIDGQYEITLLSFDSRHARLPRQEQPKEQWVLEGLDAQGKVVFTTKPSDDIPDDLAANETPVGTYDMTGVVALRARHAHALGPRDYNSVTPAGVVFTGPGGETRTFDVDALLLNSATDPDGGTVSFDYDGRYNMTQWVDQNGNATTYAYNDSDEVTSVADPLGRATTTSYDDLGRPVEVVDPSGRTFTASYDTGGRHLLTTFADGTAQQFVYDNRNRLVAEVDLDADGSEISRTSYAYDEGSNVVSVTEPDGDVIGYRYDAVGNQTRLTYPDGSHVDYGYDELNRLVSVRHSSHGETSYSYDDDSRPTRVEFPGGGIQSFGYTGEHLTSFRDGDRRWHLSYDGRGRVDEITGAEEWRFSYGDDGQVVEASRDGRTWSYTYDSVGNLTSIDDGDEPATEFTHDAANQITAAGPDGGPLEPWSHDAAGRVTNSATPGDDTTYAYDVRGRLETVTVAGADGTDTWTRTYGPDDLLATVTHTGPDGGVATYELTWDRTVAPARPLGWTGADDVTLVNGIGPAVSIADGYATRVEMGPLGDVVGSPAAVADGYGPFGDGAAVDGFGLGFRGELHVGPTINLKMRDLNPELGRFLTVDPIAPLEGSSTTSRYAYAANDPINLADPFGLSPTDNFARFLEEQINVFSLADFAAGVAGYAWDSITGLVDLAKLAWSGVSCQASVVSRSLTFGRWEVGSCDEVNALIEGTVELGQTVFQAVKNRNVGAILEILSGFLPERCAFDFDTFELDYCAGQATAALVVAVATSGAGAATNLTRLGRIADRIPSSLDEAVDSTRRFFPESDPVGIPCTGLRSFGAATLVLMADGSVTPIAEIEPGDRVLAGDPATGTTAPATVTASWVHLDLLVDLAVGSGPALTTTEDHPFWNATDHAWQRADDLDPGDHLLTAGGELVAVQNLIADSDHVDLAYNLTVEPYHTYFVLAGGEAILTHNDNGCDIPRNPDGTFARGAGGESPLTIRGRTAHNNYRHTLGGGNYRFNEPLPRSLLRPDAYDLTNRVIRELKPNTPSGIATGRRQLAGYIRYMEELTGENWTGYLDTYEP